MFVPIFSLFNLPECLCILFEFNLGGAFTIYRMVEFPPTIIEGDVVKVY